MARKLRLEYSGAIYHVTCRMIGDWRTERSWLFRDEADRVRFMEQLAERVEQHTIRLYVFALMANHYHLVFETPEGNCSRFMQTLNTAYTVYFNRRHDRHGHLLDGRFKGRLVEGDRYILALSRYVHLNPVQIASQQKGPIEERIQYLRTYQWSSYPGYIARHKRLDFVQYGPVLSEMQGGEDDPLRRYRAFVERGLLEKDEDFRAVLAASPHCIGSDDFRSEVDGLYQERLDSIGSREDVSFRRVSEPMDAEIVLSLLGEIFEVPKEEFVSRRRGSPLRAIAAQLLISYAGLTQREVANLLAIGSGAAVCNQLSRLPAKLDADDSLQSLVTRAEATLKQAKTSGAGQGRTP